MDGNRSRKRRLVRVGMLVVVAPLLLLSGFVSTWMSVSKAADKGLIDYRILTRVRPAFQPILAYSQADYPGAGALRELWWQVNSMVQPNEFGHDTVFRPTCALVLAPPEPGGNVVPTGF